MRIFFRAGKAKAALEFFLQSCNAIVVNSVAIKKYFSKQKIKNNKKKKSPFFSEKIARVLQRNTGFFLL